MKTRNESLLMSVEHASIQKLYPRTYYYGVSCPRTSYSGVNCPREESWGRDSLLQMGTAYSEVTCPRGTGCSGVKCPRTTYSGVIINGPGARTLYSAGR